MKNIAENVISALTSHSMTLATAESCTGGMIGETLTSVPGASSAYFGGVISYDNSVKHGVLGVSEQTLREFGAVSCETAREMARGARLLCKCDIAVSVTGIAGPGGGTPEKPVGTVCFAVDTKNGTRAEKVSFDEALTRDEIRRATVAHALDLVLDELGKL